MFLCFLDILLLSSFLLLEIGFIVWFEPLPLQNDIYALYRVIQNLSSPSHLKPRSSRKSDFYFLNIYFKRKRFVKFECMKRSVAVFNINLVKHFIIWKSSNWRWTAFYKEAQHLSPTCWVFGKCFGNVK